MMPPTEIRLLNHRAQRHQVPTDSERIAIRQMRNKSDARRGLLSWRLPFAAGFAQLWSCAARTIA